MASRTFTAEDQAAFAALSGDYNPLHMDAIAARRTHAGAPVVHGVHMLLWLLENLAAQDATPSAVTRLKVRFRQPVYLNERVDLHVTLADAARVQASIHVDNAPAVDVTLTLGGAGASAAGNVASARKSDDSGKSGNPSTVVTAGSGASASAKPRTVASDLQLSEMQGRSGRVPFVTSEAEMGAAFPGAARLIGAKRAAALACSSYLVGMELPGLHSVYGGLDVEFVADAVHVAHVTDAQVVAHAADTALNFAVTMVDERFRRVLLRISGGGLAGELQAFCRPAPVRQLSMETAAARVGRGEFSSAVALIVGGSRGLGEVTAKLIAAGGGKVIITYASGAGDARDLAAQINSWGGRCELAAYDVWREAAGQLRALSEAPTHIYYFATPSIARRKAAPFTRERLEEFNQFYVFGFRALLDAVRALRSGAITVFYPSSIYVEEHGPEFTEYAMAKAAGEILCADIARYEEGVRIICPRLPRLLTDQTASMIPGQAADPCQVMLPLVRDMCN